MLDIYIVEVEDDNVTGYTTYKRHLMQIILDLGYKCHNILLSSHQKYLCVEKKEGINIIYVPTCNMKTIGVLLKLVIEDKRTNVFMQNFSTSYPTLNMLKQNFPQSKLVYVIHDFIWATYVMGNFKLFKQIVNEGLEHTYRDMICASNKVFVTWFGGEPLLAFKRIQSLTRKIETLGLRYGAGMITNGYLLDRDKISELKNLHIKSIQITLDGLATIHDSRRCLKNGGKTFDKIITNLSLIDELSPETYVNIRMNIDRTNIDDFIKLYKFIQDKKYKNIFLNPAFVEDKENPKSNPCFFNSAEKALFIKQLLKEHGLSFSLLYPDYKREECSVRNPLSIVIGPQGELYKCWNDVGNPNMVYGNLDTGITNEKVLLDYLSGADPFEDNSCKKCKLLPVCSGGCPHTRLQAEKKGIKKAGCPPIKSNLKSFLLLHKEEKK